MGEEVRSGECDLSCVGAQGGPIFSPVPDGSLKGENIRLRGETCSAIELTWKR